MSRETKKLRRKRCDGCAELRYSCKRVYDSFAKRKVSYCGICRGRPGEEPEPDLPYVVVTDGRGKVLFEGRGKVQFKAGANS